MKSMAFEGQPIFMGSRMHGRRGLNVAIAMSQERVLSLQLAHDERYARA